MRVLFTLRLTLLLLIVATPVTTGTSLANQPNVLVILADDQGRGNLSFNGNSNLSTPWIDSLGREGARFDHFYVCPVCTPMRAESLTGRYHLRSGGSGTSRGQEARPSIFACWSGRATEVTDRRRDSAPTNGMAERLLVVGLAPAPSTTSSRYKQAAPSTTGR